MKPSPRYALLWLLPLGFLALFYFYPLGSILALSFGRGEDGLAAPFLEALGSESIRRVLGFTVWQAALSTLLTLALGLPAAYLFARFEFRGRHLLRALTGVPFVLPTLVVAAAFSALLGPRGWVNLALMSLLGLDAPPIEFLNSFAAILTAHVFYNLTIVLRLVGDFWARLDPRLEGAARALGAGRWAAFRHVTLPLLAPAMLAAALLVFIFDFTSFGVVLVLGGPRFATLEVEIYTQTISLFNLPLAGALSSIQLAATLALTVAYTRLNARLSRPLALRPPENARRPLNTPRRRLLAGLTLGALAVLALAPLGALAARSLVRLEPDRGQRTAQTGLTLEFYRALASGERVSGFYDSPLGAIRTSLGYAAATVALSLALGGPAAWALARRPEARLSRILDPLLMLPLGTSAVTLGLGFIVALDIPPLDLRASPLLIPLAHTLVAFPFIVRSLTPALRSIQPKLRQAAAVLGASPWQAVRHIDLPLAARAGLVAAAFAFTISLGEFGATALVARPEFPTLPVMIYRFLSQPGGLNYGQAMALATLLMVVTTIGMLGIERLRIGEAGEF
ncbi:MAG: iron ABC transporter permease [Anaerolineae bacterium]|nr:MAG: iron ABC transporter permease [Anaerolineae bacterium]